jgi:uncharacterized membrane protein (DUF2068 family)
MARKNNLLPVIAAFKITKAVLLFTVAFGLHHLFRGDVEAIITAWIHAIRIDPENQHIHSLISAATGIPKTRLHALGIGTFLYGLLFLTEGTGLMLQVRWAEYLTVVSTLGFLPLEIYELVEKPGHKGLKSIILVLNIAIAIYLIWNLRGRGSNSQDGGSRG